MTLAEHPCTLWEASLPCLPSSLTWCPSVHDGKHVNSYGSSIKHWECAETVGHRVFLHRNHGKKGNISWILHQNLHVENTCTQVSARQVELLDAKERMATCLVTLKSTMLVLASTNILGNLDTINGNQGHRFYFLVSCRPAE